MATRIAPSPTTLADEAALGAREKFEQRANLRALRRLRRELALRLLQPEPGPVQGALGALDAQDRLLAEAAPAQALAVDAERLGPVAGRLHVGRQVLRQ